MTPQGLHPLRVAAVQASSVAGDVSANVAAGVEWVEKAASRGARIVVLPELFLTGYDPATWTKGSSASGDHGSDVTVDDLRLVPLARAAAASGAAVVVGASVASDAGRLLTALCCTPAGDIELAYSKQHLWHAERAVFTPGSAGGSLEIDGWHLGLGICYDGCFPEHARAAADAGALGYLCPSAYVVGSEHRRDLYYAARALDNGFYVVLSGLTGPCGELRFCGGTAVYDPQGRRVAAVPTGEGLAVTDLDPAVIAEARQLNPYAADRPTTLGGRLTTRL